LVLKRNYLPNSYWVHLTWFNIHFLLTGQEIPKYEYHEHPVELYNREFPFSNYEQPQNYNIGLSGFIPKIFYLKRFNFLKLPPQKIYFMLENNKNFFSPFNFLTNFYYIVSKNVFLAPLTVMPSKWLHPQWEWQGLLLILREKFEAPHTGNFCSTLNHSLCYAYVDDLEMPFELTSWIFFLFYSVFFCASCFSRFLLYFFSSFYQV
jgi:hypothetical protein